MNDSMSTECLAWIQRPQYWDTGRSRVAHPLPCEADSKWGTLGTKDSKPRHLQPGNSGKEGGPAGGGAAGKGTRWQRMIPEL